MKNKPGLRPLPAFLLGFIALAWQVLLMREFAALFHGNEVVFGIFLAAWLFWTGLGSILASRIPFTPKRFAWAYFIVILIFPLVLAGLRLSRFALGLLPGETTGLFPAAFFALAGTLFICLPLGGLFVFNVQAASGRLAEVYLWEALGSTAAGTVLYFLLIPILSNWQAATLLGIAATVILGHRFWNIGKCRPAIGFCLAAVLILGITDQPTQKMYWKPFLLVDGLDSPYGKLQMLRTGEQITLYSNCAPVFSHPNPEAAEEAVHFAMLQRTDVRRALLIGGGLGGGLSQLLKYPHLIIDYVEPDPSIIRFARAHLPPREVQTLDNPRVRLKHTDGRAFMRRSETLYDVVILDLPLPTTAQLNRFYTLEFFHLVRRRLSTGGVLSFRVASAENYISPQLQNFLASLYSTVRAVFPHVEIVPGSTNVFLASSAPIALEAEVLLHRIRALELNTRYVGPAMLRTRLEPGRRSRLNTAVRSGVSRINLDLAPISYFYAAVLWSARFQGLESRLFTALGDLDRHWFLDVPLGLFLLTLAALAIRPRPTILVLTPLAVLGLTTIISEVIIIITFQALHGSLYLTLAVLFSVFMLGIAGGALRGIRRRTHRFSHLILIQAQFCLLIFILTLGMSTRPPAIAFILFLLILGYLGGNLFVTANRLYLEIKINFGIGYGVDLLGSFLGALFASSILIPLVGLLPLAKYLWLANAFCLAWLFWGWRRA